MRIPLLLLLAAVLPPLTACGSDTPAAVIADGGTRADGGLVFDGGALADGGSAADGGPMTDGGSGVDGGPATDGGVQALVTARPYNAKVPSGYDPNTPTPLVLLLHGFGANGALQDFYFGLSGLADRRNFLVAIPDGTPNAALQRYWNATDACCGNGSTVDDVAYLGAVLTDMQTRYNVDPKRIFVLGHSNGGFMAYRLACELSTRLAGIASLAGAMWKDVSHCQPTASVAVLQVHGTLDATIAYDGGSNLGGAYPAAAETVADWSVNNACGASLVNTNQPRDFELALPGAETRVEQYVGCRANGAVELWSIVGGTHVPSLAAGAVESMYDFLMAHPKP